MRQVLYAVDVTPAVVDEAISWGADLIVAHHPLLLKGVDSVAADTAKGSVIHRLIKADCALFTAHTNADSADPGVSDALASALGVIDTRPLDPIPAPAHDKWVVFVPSADTAAVRQALFDAGAGEIGDYSEASWQAACCPDLTGGCLPSWCTAFYGVRGRLIIFLPSCLKSRSKNSTRRRLLFLGSAFTN